MEKQPLSDCTRDNPIVLPYIVEFSRLLRPVGPGPLSQCPSPGYHFHGPLVKGLVSRYLANCLISRSPILGHTTNMIAVPLGVEPFQASTPIVD